MKRIIAMLLFILLFVSVFPSLGVSEGYIFTIDGIRTAFFAEDGTYLPPVEENGVVFVAAVPLAGNLNLSLTVDPEKRIVTLNGVRMAFFAEDGNLIEPILVNGTLYVPLKAFAESAGINLTIEGNNYDLTVRGGVSAETIQKQDVPEEVFGLVPLTLLNWQDYFFISHDCIIPDGYPDPFYVTYVLTIQASTGYDLVNVVFDVSDYGMVWIPASGNATSSRRGKEISGGSKLREVRGWIADEKTNAILAASRVPSVTFVKGYIRMSKAEADRTNKALFEKAVAVTLTDNIDRLEIAIETFEKLADLDYAGSADELAAARKRREEIQTRKDQEAAEATEMKNAALYEEAEAALGTADYEKAVTLFADLAKEGYRDSAAKLVGAKEAQNAKLYEEAEAALGTADYEKAVTLFADLAKEGYRDSADKLAEAVKGKDEADEQRNAARYREAEEAENSGDLEKAAEIFSELKALNFRDSEHRLNTARVHGLIARGKYSDALDYAASLPDDEQSGALYDECLFRCAMSVKAPNAAGNVWFESAARNKKLYEDTCWYLMSADGKLILRGIDEDSIGYYHADGTEITGKRYVSVRSKKAAKLDYCGDYAFVKEYNLFVDRDGKETEAPEKADFFLTDNLLSYMDTKSGKYGALDMTGKTVIKPISESALQYQNGLFRIHKRIARKGQGIENQFGLIDIKGRTIIKFAQYRDFSALSENLIIVTAEQRGQSETYLVDGKGRKIKNAPAIKGGSACGKYILLKDENNLIGIWDKDLQPMLAPCFLSVCTIVSDRCIIGQRDQDPGTVALFDLDGNRLTPAGAYMQMEADPGSTYVAAKSAEDNAWHLLDLEGNMIY